MLELILNPLKNLQKCQYPFSWDIDNINCYTLGDLVVAHNTVSSRCKNITVQETKTC